eukprot:CAMPEP_0183757118 /NCGR_PEP_ID=MMETSP0739-20130205/5515_1 /TAXON_ID=385413 /ORGANISM="Thalassiosira miniscula, Strain CCMP1093" /LENGTH=78 /DNA_ID=CAMNT_0025994471 /DNA_START=141 /DNA_END=375 /DNA_ORIENTATION=+
MAVPRARLSLQMHPRTSTPMDQSTGSGILQMVLRYLEPFALIDDPIMYGCWKGMQQKQYCDWEEALKDGRIAWSNSQW